MTNDGITWYLRDFVALLVLGLAGPVTVLHQQAGNLIGLGHEGSTVPVAAPHEPVQG
ncbi:hypothetical protein GCM10010218_63920 [Streptomyces mashuensis]|uniref:Uncharacterized protein n=1 Tax=Streptomyces mashuensis TaxID=33904 RepID=A0A919BAY9_9ACTN|nr:hypothetical protein [Streptomyces mashuensis]GHF74015.1 hypothetical protein GCM10010218_63920 [Streptomyces mashuensis]